MDSSLLTVLIVTTCATIGVPLVLFFLLKSSGIVGVFPADVKSQLEQEEILFINESVSMSVRLRKFRGPGRYANYSVKFGIGAFAVTKKRIVGYTSRSHCLIDVPIDHKKIESLRITARGENTLCVAFEASEFNAEQSGGIEVRYRLADLPQAMTILRKLTKSVR